MRDPCVVYVRIQVFRSRVVHRLDLHEADLPRLTGVIADDARGLVGASAAVYAGTLDGPAATVAGTKADRRSKRAAPCSSALAAAGWAADDALMVDANSDAVTARA